MLKHIAALAVIFIATSAAWVFLGSTVETRTRQSGSDLRNRVASVWGSPHSQAPPRLQTVEGALSRLFPAASSRLQVKLDLEPRQKGLLWFNTYVVDFQGEYTFARPAVGAAATYEFPLPAARASYRNAKILVDGEEVPYESLNGVLTARIEAKAGQPALVRISTRYRSQGQESWQYSFGPATDRVRNLDLRLRTNFRDIDFADNTMAPTAKRAVEGGWELAWTYENLLSGFPVKVVMPEQLQPGPLAGLISYFAPVSLFFFFFVMLMITTVRRIPLHPMNYFFLAASFFAFHLLFAYLADHVNVHLAFLICSLVSVFLLVSYLRLVVDLRFAAVEAGLAQFVYLILFSYAQFFEGYAGLTVTVGAIVTLFLVMQFTAKIDWSAQFSAVRPGPPPLPAFDSTGSTTVS